MSAGMATRGGRVPVSERLPLRWLRVASDGTIEVAGFAPFMDELVARHGALGTAALLELSKHRLWELRHRSEPWISHRTADYCASHAGRHLSELYPAAMLVRLAEAGRPVCRCCGGRMLAPAPACGFCECGAELELDAGELIAA